VGVRDGGGGGADEQRSRAGVAPGGAVAEGAVTAGVCDGGSGDTSGETASAEADIDPLNGYQASSNHLAPVGLASKSKETTRRSQ
jgi:hypothetical protein